MLNGILKPSLVAGILSLAVATGAQALTVQYELDGDFDDGGAVFGTFNFNTVTNAFTDINISSTDGSTLTGVTYSAATPFANDTTADFIEFSAADLTGQRNLFIQLFSPLSAATNPGDVTSILIGSGEAICGDATCFFLDPPSRQLVVGGIFAVAPIPLPAALPMLAVALGGLGLMRRRQQSA